MKKSWEQMSGWIEELHAPLGNLMGQLELRQEEMEPECYGLLWRDCQNLRSYMERLLRLIQVYAGDVPPCWGRSPLRNCVEEAARSVEKEAQEQGILLRVEYDRGDRNIWSDAKLLREILEQLIRYTLTRSASGECVTAGCTAYRDTVALWVENPSEHIIEARAAIECRGESTLRLEVCRGLAAQLGAVFFCGNGEHGGVRRGIRLPVAS